MEKTGSTSSLDEVPTEEDEMVLRIVIPRQNATKICVFRKDTNVAEIIKVIGRKST